MDENRTADGMLRAFHHLLVASSKPAGKRPKYRYEDEGEIAVHLAVCRSALSHEHRVLDEAGERVRIGGTRLKYVPVKRAHLVEHNRYSTDDLRAIRRAGGGAKEQARAQRRRKEVILFTASTGNVFADLDLPDADGLLRAAEAAIARMEVEA